MFHFRATGLGAAAAKKFPCCFRSTVASPATEDISAVKKVKSFNEIPGPKPIPLLGSNFRYFPIVGEYDWQQLDVAQRKKYDKYGKIVLERNLGNENVVSIFDPNDIEKVKFSEGTYPQRPVFKAMEKIRRQKQYSNPGLFMSHGQEWYDVRSKSQQVMMRPKVIQEIAESVDLVAIDLVKKLRQSKSLDGKLKDDMFDLTRLWGLESICYILFCTRLGMLSEHLNERNNYFLQQHNDLFRLTQELDYSLPLWQIFPKLSRKYKQFVACHDGVYDAVMDLISEAKKKAETQELKEDSVMAMILKQMDPELATIIAIDTIFAGVDTTAGTLVKLLKCLADNPHCQEVIREEAQKAMPEKGQLMTPEVIEKVPYVKAALKETLRIFPIFQGAFRKLPQDTVLSGYEVPAGTVVMVNSFLPSMQEQYFPEHERFVPERWIKGSQEYERLRARHSHATAPFGVGVRMCIGRRIAEIELYTAVTRIVENFVVQYEDSKPMEIVTPFVWLPKQPLGFRLLERK